MHKHDIGLRVPLCVDQHAPLGINLWLHLYIGIGLWVPLCVDQHAPLGINLWVHLHIDIWSLLGIVWGCPCHA